MADEQAQEQRAAPAEVWEEFEGATEQEEKEWLEQALQVFKRAGKGKEDDVPGEYPDV